MPTISVNDNLGLKLEISFNDASDVARLGLKTLASTTSQFTSAAGTPLDQTNFRSAVFGADLTSPKIPLVDQTNLLLSGKASAAIEIFRASDKVLFAGDDSVFALPISAREAWVRFDVETSFALEAAVPLPSGFGVKGEHERIRKLSTYARISANQGHFPTVKEAAELALSQFRILRDAASLRGQSPDTILESDVSGTFAFIGQYHLPLAPAGFALVTANLPLHQHFTVAPLADWKFSGSLAVTGDFICRSFRKDPTTLYLGLFKKRESDLTAGFSVAAGVAAVAGSADLAATLFKALPGVNWDEASLPAPERKLTAESLKDAAGKGLSIALNAVCSASFADEAALLFSIDLSDPSPELDDALNAALSGDWTALARSPRAKELRNVLTKTHEAACRTSLHLLGVYDYVSLNDFIRSSTILHDLETGDITVTDRETAQRISTAAAPRATDDERLRKVLDEAFLATVTYTALGGGLPVEASLEASQSLLLYRNHCGLETLKKDLLLGVALQVIKPEQIAQLPPQREFKYVRLFARLSIGGEAALALFYSDPVQRVAHREQDLKRLGRSVLASLLDSHVPGDRTRIQALQDDSVWQKMEEQKFPRDSPASYSDWFDITFWATSVVALAPRLTDVLNELDRSTSADPTTNPQFMSARDALAKALGRVTRNTKAAFEKSWPLAITYALCQRRLAVNFEARWDGAIRFTSETAPSRPLP